MQFLSLLLAAALAGASIPAVSAEIRFGSLQVDWPEGFSAPSAAPPFELTGPAGEKVLVTVMRPGKEMDGDAAAVEQRKMALVGEEFLRRQSDKAGKTIVSLSRTILPNGSLLISTGAATTSLFSPGYFVQYLLVSPAGRLGFFTIEGKGDPAEIYAKFLPVVSTATWLP